MPRIANVVTTSLAYKLGPTVEKNRERMGTSRKIRGRVEKKLREVVKRHPGTRSAELAEARISGLPPAPGR